MAKKLIGSVKCSLDDIIFPVEKIKAGIDPDSNEKLFECNSDYEYDIFGYIGGNIEKGIIGSKRRLNSCSSIYELVPNSDIFIPVKERLENSGISFTEEYEHINYARFYGYYRINDIPYKVGGNDNDIIYPMLKVFHSYNGLTQYGITFGYYRFVCSNGLVIPVKEKEYINLAIIGKHTQNINNVLIELQKKIEMFSEKGNELVKRFDKLIYDRPIHNVEDRIIEVMEANNLISLKQEKARNERLAFVSNVVYNEIDLYGGVANDWLIYNAINQFNYNPSFNIKAPEKRYADDLKVYQYIEKNPYKNNEKLVLV